MLRLTSRTARSRGLAGWPLGTVTSSIDDGSSQHCSDRNVRKSRLLAQPAILCSSAVAPFAISGYANRSIAIRFISSNSGSSSSSTEKTFSSSGEFNDASGNVDDTLNKLFAESQQNMAASDAAAAAASGLDPVAWEPTWYNLSDQAIVAVQNFHELTGLQYGWSIVGVTIILRLCLFPLMVQSQQTTSRMAHLQPELQHMKARYEALGTPSRQDQLQFSNKMKALFAKYNVKPFRAFTAPLVQLPLFMGMFFGLRKMPKLLPEELSDGGMFWFTDLTATDPYYVLPLASATTFLLLIEMGKDQMMAQNAAQGEIMLNVFRGLSLLMIPVCVNFESAMLVYWTSNNLLTMGQTAILKAPTARKYFGIWDPPLPVPGTKTQAASLTESVSQLAERLQGKAVTSEEKMRRHNRAVDNRKKAFAMMRNPRTSRKGITGTQNETPSSSPARR